VVGWYYFSFSSFPYCQAVVDGDLLSGIGEAGGACENGFEITRRSRRILEVWCPQNSANFYSEIYGIMPSALKFGFRNRNFGGFSLSKERKKHFPPAVAKPAA
jgi:hypothetical protein